VVRCALHMKGRISQLMLLAPLPALLIGILLMRRSGVSSAIWGQQLAAGLALVILCAVLRVVPRTTSQSTPWKLPIAASAALLVLVATLFHPGVEGVRRWVTLGPLQLHAAFIALPVLIIVLGRIVRSDVVRGAWLLPLAVAIAAGVLVLQPDASQAIAFAIAVVIILVPRNNSSSTWAAVGIAIAAALFALTRPDPLDAVPHVEGIVGLAASAGMLWMISALVALLLLPVPFIADAVRHHERRRVSLALAAYFIAVCVASLLQPFPVPLLGFGLLPILGYFLALAWIMRSDRPANA
jgi:cell division protein FtsW (lipid II flippase)